MWFLQMVFQVRFLQAIDLCLGSCSKTVFEKATSQTLTLKWTAHVFDISYGSV